tara:strand:+ start:712 stop:915 length:204 start_codon:yes stop_codon:yes gene_type:complete
MLISLKFFSNAIVLVDKFIYLHSFSLLMERMVGTAPTSRDWKPLILLLYDIRIIDPITDQIKSQALN